MAGPLDRHLDEGQVAFIPLEDLGKTGNFEVVAWPNGHGVEPSVLLHAKNGRGQGHVDSEKKVQEIVRQLKELLA
ncbi:hypothetical protein H310_15200 [Aphanomyces invadans]|uniref:Uncharacterized protein n=1 Tax=Aphanomyces invadans TaxID=157072 RepID=A0A024T7U1_9STRA|nr:hypothetical protein H310_15200 [Aphanomyces invadans]ETV89963.1 hypothetical protein H310_15200 [Aphanomyces invadans]|eukprot:XP_008881407.1 hypothetical protein H310_15200 [Aphanomyces invadans]